MTVASRIGVMNRGSLVQVAPPHAMYEQPNSRWVADFIGDVNLIEGRVVAADTVEAAGGARLRVVATAGVRIGDAVWIALRPEKIAIAAADGGQRADALVGEVTEIGYRGDTSVYKVRLDNGLVLKASAANTRRQAPPIGRNDRVALSWALDAAVVLTQ